MLSMKSDRVRLTGRTIATFTSGVSGGVASVNATQTLFGNRAVQFGFLYTRWKINRMIFKLLNVNAGASTGVSALGVLDDDNNSSDVPTSLLGIAQLRCASTYPTSDSNTVTPRFPDFEWQPPRGPTKWFYTQLQGSGTSDSRLEIPCSIWFACNQTTAVTFSIELNFDISYEGAVDLTSS